MANVQMVVTIKGVDLDEFVASGRNSRQNRKNGREFPTGHILENGTKTYEWNLGQPSDQYRKNDMWFWFDTLIGSVNIVITVNVRFCSTGYATITSASAS